MNGQTLQLPTRFYVDSLNRDIDVSYRVIDANDLIASHDILGNINKAYPESLQPRDRSKATSVNQIIQMSSNIRPERLVFSGDVATGAPIISKDMIVESGKGRTIALQHAYKEGRGDNYKKYLQDLDPDLKTAINTLKELAPSVAKLEAMVENGTLERSASIYKSLTEAFYTMKYAKSNNKIDSRHCSIKVVCLVALSQLPKALSADFIVMKKN